MHRTIVDALVEAWNHQSASAVAGLFVANGRVHARAGTVFGVGNAAIRDVFWALREATAGGYLRVNHTKTIRLGNNRRLLRVQWFMTGHSPAAALEYGHFTLLACWNEGRWQIEAMDLEDLGFAASEACG